MKTLIICVCAFFCCSVSLFANQHVVTKNQILLTNEGIFCDIDGSLQQVDTINYLNGYYLAIPKPQAAGSCSQCGSRRGPDGKCQNPYCNNSGRNGPREKD